MIVLWEGDNCIQDHHQLLYVNDLPDSVNLSRNFTSMKDTSSGA